MARWARLGYHAGHVTREGELTMCYEQILYEVKDRVAHFVEKRPPRFTGR